MVNDAPLVLISRPLAQSNEFQKMLGGNVESLVSPVLEIRLLSVTIDPSRYGAFVFTSRNGVRAAAQLINLGGLRAYAVGNRTADFAAGFGMDAISANGDSDALFNAILFDNPTGKLLFLRGEYSRGDIAEKLNLAGLETESAIVYRQESQQLSPAAEAVLCGANPVLIPLFSPRSSGLMGAELKRINASARCCLIGMSRNVIEAWYGPVPEKVVVADDPNISAMVEKTLQQFRGWS